MVKKVEIQVYSETSRNSSVWSDKSKRECIVRQAEMRVYGQTIPTIGIHRIASPTSEMHRASSQASEIYRTNNQISGIYFAPSRRSGIYCIPSQTSEIYYTNSQISGIYCTPHLNYRMSSIYVLQKGKSCWNTTDQQGLCRKNINQSRKSEKKIKVNKNTAAENSGNFPRW